MPIALSYAHDVSAQYRYWRIRILASTIFGYALYYFVRTNISVPLKAMSADLGYSKERLGVILTVGGLTYGVSKFVNGFIGDHANPRSFMAMGLAVGALMNFFFGISSTLPFFIGFWFLNNYAQGMGFPPCAKSMGHWFSPRERASTFGIWHSSHMIGGALISLLTGYLVKYYGWRSCFTIPAILAAIGAVIVWIFLRDTPESLGLPPVEIFKNEESPEELAEELHEPVPVAGAVIEPVKPPLTYWEIVIENVFKNPFMWIISLANLAVYVLRYAQLTWGPTFLQETKGMTVVTSGWLASAAEIGGLFGALVGGFVTDKLFNGRAGRVCVIAMGLMVGVIYLFWITPASSPILNGLLFVAMGFLLYVPQMLIAAIAMNLGTKRASAAAVGLTGIVGYGSTLITGWGIGRLVDRHGWPAAFALMGICAVITLVLMALTWNVGAHPESAKDAADA